VLDGDSLRCADRREIRLLLIDAPEWGQAPWGDLARAVLVDLAPPGSSLDVVYDIQRTDSFGRDLAYLYLPGGAMVNERMAWLG
jgi:endonuclease YncB( thermonuclease family)